MYFLNCNNISHSMEKLTVLFKRKKARSPQSKASTREFVFEGLDKMKTEGEIGKLSVDAEDLKEESHWYKDQDKNLLSDYFVENPERLSQEDSQNEELQNKEITQSGEKTLVNKFNELAKLITPTSKKDIQESMKRIIFNARDNHHQLSNAEKKRLAYLIKRAGSFPTELRPLLWKLASGSVISKRNNPGYYFKSEEEK